MSEPPPPETMAESAMEDDSQPPAEKSQLSEGILNALRQLQESSMPPAIPSTPTPTSTQPSSQEPSLPMSVPAPEPTPPPQSEWDQLRAQLREKPVDADGWQKLIALAEDSGDIEKIKETYDGVLETYPNTSSVQIAYLRHFLDDPSRYPYAVKLFQKFLPKSAPSVDILKLYLTYIRRVNPSAFDVIQKCFDFALGHAGQDKDSYEIWQDYINFLKARKTETTWEEQQNMDAIRKAYQQAVQIPMENVKRLWEDYQDFENNLNKITAKKFISDLQENHMQARTVLNQLQEHLTVLFPPLPAGKDKRPSIWLPRVPTFNHGDKALVARWRLYLKWEEGNPLEIEEANRGTFLQRMQGVYKKAIVRMRFYSEIWYMAYAWTKSIGKTEEALALLKAGIDANPASFVLNFAYAEELELENKYTEVHATFTKFLETLRKDLEALETRVNVSSSSNGSSSSQQQSHIQSNGDGPASQQGLTSNHSSFNTQASDEKPPKNKELCDRRTDYGIAWIVYIRFARRAEGLQSARNVFSKARRDRWTPWEVHDAEALMEYHCDSKNSGVACRIFEKAMELYGDEVELVLRYLNFLISINDENNARALFERVIGTFSPEKARPLWERWSKYEYQYGNLAAAHKLEKRMAEVYPNDPPIKRFAERHKYGNVDSIATRDLGFVLGKSSSGSGRSNGSSSGLLGRSDTLQSIVSDTAAKAATPAQGSSSSKRASSPDHRRRDESRDYPSKRARPSSPGPGRGRDRDRWDGPPPHRRHGSPVWDREREREGPPPSARARFKEEKEEEKGVQLPSVLSWFIGTLPAPSAFDGPVFRTDDLMQHFRNAVIPSSSGKPRSPPPPPARSGGGGRPPPDYGPYQGPGSSGRRGRW